MSAVDKWHRPKQSYSSPEAKSSVRPAHPCGKTDPSLSLEECLKKREAEAALLQYTREQAELWQSLFEHHPAMKFLINPETIEIEDANAAACRFFGLSKEAFRNVSPPWFIDVDAQTLHAGLRDAAEGKRTRFIGSRKASDGKVRTVEAWIGPVQFAGKPLLYAIVFDATDRVAQERVINEKNAALARQNRTLAEKNIAIQEIAVQVELSKKRTVDALTTELGEVALPIAARLRACRLDPNARRLVDVLERAIRDIVRKECRAGDYEMHGLTAREQEICNLIRNGLSSKEIAGILGISHRSVENHRHTVRRKLGFDRSVNLGTYLSNSLK